MKCCLNCSYSEGCKETCVIYCRKLQKLIHEFSYCSKFKEESFTPDPYD